MSVSDFILFFFPAFICFLPVFVSSPFSHLSWFAFFTGAFGGFGATTTTAAAPGSTFSFAAPSNTTGQQYSCVQTSNKNINFPFFLLPIYVHVQDKKMNIHTALCVLKRGPPKWGNNHQRQSKSAVLALWKKRISRSNSETKILILLWCKCFFMNM